MRLRAVCALAVVIATAAVAGVALGGPGMRPSESALAAGRDNAADGISSAGETRLALLNLDPSNAAGVVGSFHAQTGAPPVEVYASAIAPFGAWRVGPGELMQLPDGAYAARLESDRTIGGVIDMAWPVAGGRVAAANAGAGTDVIVPFVTRGLDGHYTLLTIQNADASAPASVRVSLTELGSSEEVLSLTLSILPGTSTTIDFAGSEAVLSLPEGFVGSARLSSDAPIAASVIGDIETSRVGVYAYEGIPVADASTDLYAPRIHSSRAIQPGATPPVTSDSFIAVHNPGPDDGSAVATFRGTEGVCTGLVFTLGPVPAPAGATVIIPGGQTSPGLTDMGSVLMGDCAVSAHIADPDTGRAFVGTVVELAHDAAQGDTLAAAYTVLSQSEAASRVGLPTVRRDSSEMSSEITAMNAGPSEAEVGFDLYDDRGDLVLRCDGDCAKTIAPGYAALWRLGDLEGVADGSALSAVVVGDGPLAAMVTDASTTGRWDMTAFTGAAPDRREFLSPVYLAGGPHPATPTRQPTATATATTASMTPTVGSATPTDSGATPATPTAGSSTPTDARTTPSRPTEPGPIGPTGTPPTEPVPRIFLPAAWNGGPTP